MIYRGILKQYMSNPLFNHVVIVLPTLDHKQIDSKSIWTLNGQK